MKIILTRTPGNLLSHWKPIFRLFLSLLFFISFSKMDFFSPQMRSQFLFRLGQWCSWRGWQQQAASQTVTQKTSVRIFTINTGTKCEGSCFLAALLDQFFFSGRNLLHQWPRECILRWFNQSWKSQHRKGLQFSWLDTMSPVWELLRNVTDVTESLARLCPALEWLVAAAWPWFSKALKHTLNFNFFN